jgi:hypothetical protein
MFKSVKMIFGMLILGALLTLPLIGGCKGSETREKVDDTVEELAGKKQVDQMQKMQEDIGEIADKNLDKYKEFDETESGEE